MSFSNTFIHIASCLFFVFLAVQSSYLFFFALAGRLFSLKHYKHIRHTGRFVIYLFCEKEENIIEAAKAAVSLCYPSEKKHIVVMTNKLQAATAAALRDMSVQIIEVNTKVHHKTEALRQGLEQTAGDFDYALLLNAGEVCTKGFLYRMNDALQSGFGAVQGQHVVKNNGSAFALLDAISEGIDTHIFCTSHQLLGLSSSLTGSGAGIRFSLLKEMVPMLSATEELDKEMELYLLRRHIQFGYAPKACLYEERKNRHHNAHQKYSQWATGRVRCLRAYLSGGISELCKGNLDFTDKVFQRLLLPRILLLGITPFLVLLSFLNVSILSTDYWIGLWVVTYIAILMSMPAKYITNHFLQFILFLPVSFISMVKLFVKPKKRSSQSQVTYSSAA